MAPKTTPSSAAPVKLQDSALSGGSETQVINAQNQEISQRFLLGEAIELQLPKPESLMPLGDKLPPIRLEANYTEPVSLKDVLLYAMANTLAIRITYANEAQQKWNLVGAGGGFLPNIVTEFPASIH